jgi:uncharacterized membrane protein YqjE
LNNKFIHEEVREKNGGKTLAAAISELKEDLTQFLQTRYQMLAQEMKQKLTSLKMALPMLAAALLLGLFGIALLTVALVAAIALAIGWGLALLVVGILYVAGAGIAGWMGYKEVSQQGMAPKRTLRVLKQDQAWLQNEARSA